MSGGIGKTSKGLAEECAVVATERVIGVTPLPAGIVGEGERVAVAPVGSPDTANSTGFASVEFQGVTVRLKAA